MPTCADCADDSCVGCGNEHGEIDLCFEHKDEAIEQRPIGSELSGLLVSAGQESTTLDYQLDIDGEIDRHSEYCERRLAQEAKINAMDEFEAFANKALGPLYKPMRRTKNGLGFVNEYLNDCWLVWKAAMNKYSA